MWNDETTRGSGIESTRSSRLVKSLTRVLRRRPTPRPISLGLQGGGSFGAFTWGVLDRLLERGEVSFECVSGASAGAINAVVLADGLARGGPDEARASLERFWMRASEAVPRSPFRGTAAEGMTQAALGLMVRVFSPTEFNPLGLDPLRELLAQEIDFERLRRASPVRLLIAATRVRDGGTRLFREHELTVDAVMASACLPLLHPAVEIEEEPYWDGGYSANPPLRALALESDTPELLLVRIIPRENPRLPKRPPDVSRRADQIAFNAPLEKELESLEELCRLCRSGGVAVSAPCRKLARLRLHVICADQVIAGLGHESALDLDRAFLERLRKAGRGAADDWWAHSDRPRHGRSSSASRSVPAVAGCAGSPA